MPAGVMVEFVGGRLDGTRRWIQEPPDELHMPPDPPAPGSITAAGAEQYVEPRPPLVYRRRPGRTRLGEPRRYDLL